MKSIIYCALKRILLAGLLSTALQCQKQPQKVTLYAQSPILYAFYYENFAWGYQYRGWYVDNLGIVWNIDEQTSLKFHAHADSIFTGKQLKNLLDSAAKSSQQLTTAQLQELHQLLQKAKDGPINPPIYPCVDAGIFAYYGFTPVENSPDHFRAILLLQAGDQTIINSSPSAMQLVDKLRYWVDKDSSAIPCLPPIVK